MILATARQVQDEQNQCVIVFFGFVERLNPRIPLLKRMGFIHARHIQRYATSQPTPRKFIRS